ncbi:MAG: hypothetical protein R3F61_15605 [Myxococcota bacterium]
MRALLLILEFEFLRVLRQLLPLVASVLLLFCVLCGGALTVRLLAPDLRGAPVWVVVRDAELADRIQPLARSQRVRRVELVDVLPDDARGVIIEVPDDPVHEAWSIDAPTREEADRVEPFVRFAQEHLRREAALTEAQQATLVDRGKSLRRVSDRLRDRLGEYWTFYGTVFLWMWVGGMSQGLGYEISAYRDDGLFGLLRIGTPASVIWLAAIVQRAVLLLLSQAGLLLLIALLVGPKTFLVMFLLLGTGVAVGSFLGSFGRDLGTARRNLGLVSFLYGPVGLMLFVAPAWAHGWLVWVPVVGLAFLPDAGPVAWLAHTVLTVVGLRMGVWAHSQPEPLGSAIARWRRR